jgi:predicted NUDIX family NTP pyrophosphohydrolase
LERPQADVAGRRRRVDASGQWCNSAMAKRQSAGILLYRRRDGAAEVLLVHPGGPLWSKKDDGAWSIPKGEFEPGESAEAVAVRELREETGCEARGELMPLPPCRQPGGKVVLAFAVAGDCDTERARSNSFTMEWPPRSGRMQEFPEVDRAGWFGLGEARRKIMPGQRPLLDGLSGLLGKRSDEHG